ncbi:hypothetical protein FC093_00945 [Ilyomonas limi]|uniref:PKD/Chitinase domain-containing protein n=1 Tax=Ilyomonas limi TaxID=2575867 RepID=A0A4U3L967_9BACT|nr:hypothetical protein [Ilyomonas limi]TKK71622.1 hypothetical protein FC093_00945 [Ilyomonas limi]
MSTQIRVIKELSVSAPGLMCSITDEPQVVEPASTTAPFKKGNAVSRYFFFAVMIATLFLASCQKEQLANPVLNSTASDDLSAAVRSDMPPKVDAGGVKRIVAPANSAILSGRASDNEGPVTIKWTQTGGNSIATIADPTSITTNVSGLTSGIYTFVLTATDAKGVSRSDSTYVSVLQKMTWTVEGTTREALVHLPTGGSGAAPVMFAFHGHGGTDLGFAERAFEVNWPEAIVVYPQGLPTTSPGDKTGKGNGWQHSVGEVNGRTGIADQDLKFFDAMLATVNNTYHGDAQLVFVHGWSNGGEFVYDVLWTARGDKLTALAPAAATVGTINGKKPLPVMHVAGTEDNKVRFNNQQQSVDKDRTVNICSSTGTPWAKGTGGLAGTEYASSINNQVVSLQYKGGHSYPFTVPPYIVQFFKEVAGM